MDSKLFQIESQRLEAEEGRPGGGCRCAQGLTSLLEPTRTNQNPKGSYALR